jgi:hypothetical protein
VYDLRSKRAVFEYHEKPTDKRILRAALAALADGIARGRGLEEAETCKSSNLGASASSVPPNERAAVAKRSYLSLGSLSVTVAVGRSVTDRGSIFIALAAFPIPTARIAAAATAAMRRHASLAGATHRIAASRASDGTERKDDDGEARAGGVLLASLRRSKVVGAAIVVARWYGGQNIGKARFKHICERAATLLRGCGHIEGRPGSLVNAGWLSSGRGRRLGSGTGTGAPQKGPDDSCTMMNPSLVAVSTAAKSSPPPTSSRHARRLLMLQAAERRAQSTAAEFEEPEGACRANRVGDGVASQPGKRKARFDAAKDRSVRPRRSAPVRTGRPPAEKGSSSGKICDQEISADSVGRSAKPEAGAEVIDLT